MVSRKTWPLKTLGDLIRLQRGYDLPTKNRRPGDVPILGSFGITGSHDRSKVKGPGVTIGRSGASIGVATFSETDFWPLNTALYVKDFCGNDPRFAYYVLRSIDFRRFNTGSAQPSLNRNHIHPMPLAFPDVPEQRAISRLLGRLDDKIALNRRMNETLEAPARTIFRSWFVDFDPVTAKSEGRRPAHMSRETAELFPDSFQESEIGPIPKGWRVTRLDEVVDVNARTFKRPNAPETIEYIDISSVSRGQLRGTTRYDVNRAPSRAKRLIADGDTIWSCVRPNRMSYLYVYAPEDDVVVSTGFAVLSPRKVGRAFLYLQLTTPEFVHYLVTHAEGSAYPAVRPEVFKNSAICVAPRELMSGFEDAVYPLIHRMARNAREARSLASIRDALLPKLLSGQMRLREAERAVEEVVG